MQVCDKCNCWRFFMTWICGESTSHHRWGKIICILTYEHDEHIYDVSCTYVKLLFGKYSIQLLNLLESIVDEYGIYDVDKSLEIECDILERRYIEYDMGFVNQNTFHQVENLN